MGNELTPWEGYLTPEKTEPVKNGDTSAFIAPKNGKTICFPQGIN